MRLDGYIRVSRVGGRVGDSFISPDVQREQIERWADLRGVTIADWHTDLDQTGGKLSRPGLDAMMERVRNRETDGIVVARLDRLSRAGVADALKLVEEVAEHSAKLAVVDLGVDPTTTFGEFATTIMLALARMERRRIAENWKVARERAIGRGWHFTVPVGYERDAETGRLVPNEHAERVREVFRRKAAGASWGDLARYLNDAGVPTTTGSRWQPRGVAHLIAKRVYLGEVYHGDANRLPGAHEPLVSVAEWEAANRTRPAVNDGDGRLLSGLVRCAGCRHAMKGARAQARGKTYEQYRCKKHHAAGRCEAPATALASLLDPIVEARFLEWADAHHAGAAPVESSAALDEATRRLQDAEAELDGFTSDLEVRKLLGPDRWRENVRVRVEAVDAARAEVAELAGGRGSLGFDAQHVRDVYPDLPMPERRRLLASAIETVFVRAGGRGAVPIEDRVMVLFKGDPRIRDDLPRRGGRAYRAGELRPFRFDVHPVDAGVETPEQVAEGA
jgi:site-specific DNA recombinase